MVTAYRTSSPAPAPAADRTSRPSTAPTSLASWTASTLLTLLSLAACWSAERRRFATATVRVTVNLPATDGTVRRGRAVVARSPRGPEATPAHEPRDRSAEAPGAAMRRVGQERQRRRVTQEARRAVEGVCRPPKTMRPVGFRPQAKSPPALNRPG